MREILVTGAAGFIGSHLVDRLLDGGGWHVTGIDSYDPFYDRRIKERNLAPRRDDPRLRLLELDLRDADALRRQLDGPYDAIVHLAARAGVRPSIEDPIGYQATNVQGTQNLLELAKMLGVKQFVFASSSSVYGVNPNVPWSERDRDLLPISPYASTKVSAELLGHVYSHLYGIRFLALRFFNVYGPRQRPDLALSKFTRQILEGETIRLYGDGSSRRDYTYIDDTIAGVMAAIAYDRSDYEVVNLGNGSPVTLLEMVATIEGALGVDARVEHIETQPGDVPQTWADIAEAERLLGYRPETPFAHGVERFLDWQRQLALRPG